MIWLTWRQMRTQAAVVLAALAALGLALAITGGGLSELADASGGSFLARLGSGDSALYLLGSMTVIALPGVIGVFWGAPLVARELDAGTHRLAWSQTVTRTRWLATRAGLTGSVAIAAVALASLLMTWWCGPIDAAINDGQAGDGVLRLSRLEPAIFAARGIAPVGYATFAFALGVAAGMVLRRTVPAMVVTLAIFVAVQVIVPTWVRPHLAPERVTTAITATNLKGLIIEGPSNELGPVRDVNVDIGRPGGWITSSETLDAAGEVVELLPAWAARCASAPSPDGGEAAGASSCFERLAERGYRQRVTYVPADRYWPLQAYEAAIFLGLAALLSTLSFWWLRHRLA